MADGGKVIIKIDGDDSGFKKVSGKIGNVAGTMFKAVSVGAVTAGTAIGAIGAAAVKAYGDFEQLSGGAKLLFGDAFSYVEEQAKNAFQTVQMSQNEYLQQVNGFATGLKTALGGNEQAAAELADKIIRAEADIVAATGNTKENVQNAFNGIMKSNYTMLDNLQLGITPTKEGFQEMIDKVNEWNTANGNATKYQIDNLADAQSALIDYIEMQGLSGYASMEASGTIQGSLAMVKAAWENLMIGLADPSQNLDVLIDNVINSATTLLENLMPVIDTVLESLPTMIGTLGTKLLESLPGLVNTLLPALADTASQLINVLVASLTSSASTLGSTALTICMTLVNTLLDNIPLLIEVAFTLIVTIAEGLVQALPQLIPAVVETVLKIVDTLLDNIDMLINVSIELILALADGLIEALPKLIDKVPEIVIKLVDAIIRNAPKMYEAAGELVGKLLAGILACIPRLLSGIVELVFKIKETLITWFTQTLPECGANLVSGLWNGITAKWDWLVGKIKEWCGNILDKIKAFFGIHSPSTIMRDAVGKMLAMGLIVGVDSMRDKVVSSLSSLTTDTRTEVQKVIDEMNKELLDSEKKYNEESIRLKNSKKEADKQYLENLKKTAEQERKIYDARQKDIENAKNKYVADVREMAEKAFDLIEDLQEKQEAYSDKLKDNIKFTSTQTKKVYSVPGFHIGKDGIDQEFTALTDLDEYTESIKRHNAQMLSIKDIVPESLYNELLEMSTEELGAFINAFMALTPEQQREYVTDYKELMSAIAESPKEVFADEAAKLANTVIEEFEKTPEEFFQIGKDSISQFGEGFLSMMSEVMSEVRLRLSGSLAQVMPGMAIAGGGTTLYTDNSKYTIIAGSQSERELINQLNQNKLYEAHVRGW